MFGKRTLKNFFNIVLKRIISFSAKNNKTFFIFFTNFFFLFFYFLEKLRKRDSTRVILRLDKNNNIFYIFDYFLKEKIYFYIPVRVLGFKKGLKVKYEKFLNYYHLKQIHFKKNDLVVDVGANIGEIKKSLDYYGAEIKYVGIEPSVSEFKILNLNCTNSSNINAGCWNRDGEKDFFISSESADSSFIKTSSKIEDIKKTKIIKLENILSEKIKLLKIDAEGGEKEVLEGAKNIMNLIEYISVDVGYERGEQKASTFVEVNKLLKKFNFDLIAFDSKLRVVALYKNSLMN